MTYSEEEWKPVVGFEEYYEVSSKGSVRSTITRWGRKRYRLLKPRMHSGGYLRINLCKNKRPKDHYIHELVLTAFAGKCPAGAVRNHIDGKKTNNAIENLEYVTPSRNNQHALENGLIACGSEHPNAVLTEEQVKEMRRLANRYGTYQLASRFGVCHAVVNRILSRKSWKHVR